jgi:putative membrane protein
MTKHSKLALKEHAHNEDVEASRRRMDHAAGHSHDELLGCGWKTTNHSADASVEEEIARYENFKLLQCMLAGDKTRRDYLERHGIMQMKYTKSNDGWIPTLFNVKGRALDRIYWPWALLTLNAVLWTLVVELHLGEYEDESDGGWETFFATILNTTLAFLLVFRLNRAAERFWIARQNWGIIVGVGRNFVGGVLVHGHHNPQQRDEAIKWVAAFSIATMQFMRGIRAIDERSLAGVLEKTELLELQNAQHAPLYAACQIRNALQELFCISYDTPTGMAHLYSQQLQMLEGSLNVMMDNAGAMERIKSTPLPLVYVTHLRTFLILFLTLLPYIWAGLWGWTTIPVVFVTSFAFLGIEGASQEVESPFHKDRPNHLSMDAFCLVLMTNIQQIMQHGADREIQKRRATESERTTTSIAPASKDA